MRCVVGEVFDSPKDAQDADLDTIEALYAEIMAAPCEGGDCPGPVSTHEVGDPLMCAACHPKRWAALEAGR